jgi:hypothetical protein
VGRPVGCEGDAIDPGLGEVAVAESDWGDFDTDYPDPDDWGQRAAHCTRCKNQAWGLLAGGAWRCRDCGQPRDEPPLVSSCCEARLTADATRTYCTACGRCVYDLNGPGAYDAHMYACPDCGGNGHAGGIDDLNCSTCEGDGLLER